MSTTPICPCDATGDLPITNGPGLAQIAFRAGNFNDFRSALLTPLLAPAGQPPLEQSLSAWQSGVGADPSVVDLGVMMVEWWAYLADILTFYNERIANENYLRTAMLPETPAQLVQILGYRPRPAIGAQGVLAALLSPSILPGQTVTLPAGLQFQSKPGPGGAPQTFELVAATIVSQPGEVASMPPPTLVDTITNSRYLITNVNLGYTSRNLLGPSFNYLVDFSYARASMKVLPPLDASGSPSISTSSAAPVVVAPPSTPLLYYQILLKGSVTSVNIGSLLLLGTRDDTASGAPLLITLWAAPNVQTVAPGIKQTLLSFTAPAAPAAMTAANARLSRNSQTTALWSANGTAIDATRNQIQLASLVRQIRPDDWIVLSAPAAAAACLCQVSATLDIVGDAGSQGSPSNVPAATSSYTPIPVLHTLLTVIGDLMPLAGIAASAISLSFGSVEVGTLIDQPPSPFDGTAPTLQPIQPAQFPPGTAVPVLLQDANGNGGYALATADSGDLSLAFPASANLPLTPAFTSPIGVFYNLLPVTRGKTVANEILGSGDATVAGASFMLSKSPVTYLMSGALTSGALTSGALTSGATYASTIALTVNGQPWTEVVNFYGQAAKAQVFVTREDSSENTWVEFGDGVNGARLPTGTNNVVCSYRIGAGAASPPAGKLTVIAQSYPGLQSIVNPVPVSGGSDADPASLLKQYAPQSVLAFGRAVSVFDYQALAAQAPGVSIASATWSWDASNLRGAVTVYVAGEPNVASTVQSLLSAAGDPNRPVNVLAAVPAVVTLTLTLVIAAGVQAPAIEVAVQGVLCDPVRGLFSPPQIAIGGALFDSVIAAACLSVSGVIAVTGSQFTIDGTLDTNPLHSPGEGGYFTLDPSAFFPSTEVAANAD